MKMIALRDFLHPQEDIKVRGTVFELDDEPLCEYLVDSQVLAHYVEPEPVVEPVKEPVKEPEVAPTKSK